MAPKNFKVTVDKLPGIAKALKELAETRVMVGVPGDKIERKEDGEGQNPINNAALMAIHESGAPEANIPARPVVHPTISDNKANIEAYLEKAGDRALDGDVSGMNKTYAALGLFMQNKLRAKITTGPFDPLSERTLAGRRAKGRTGTKPLIDTGQLRRALTYVIRKVKWAGQIFARSRI